MQSLSALVLIEVCSFNVICDCAGFLAPKQVLADTGTAVGVTPLPFYVCSCHEALWREHYDPLYVAPVDTTISMVVELPYRSVNFTEALQNGFKNSVAAAADTMLDQVTINSITDVEQPAERRRLLTTDSRIEVDFSVRVPGDSQGASATLNMIVSRCDVV